MSDVEQLETSLLKIIASVRTDDWVPLSIGDLIGRLQQQGTAHGVPSYRELVDCALDLKRRSLLEIRKFVGTTYVQFDFSKSGNEVYEGRFFGSDSFEARLTHEGRKALSQFKINPADNMGPEQLDDLLPIFRRRVFDSDLEPLLTQAKADTCPLALVYLDIDKFKQKNDTFSHQVGDEILRGVAAVLARAVRNKGKAYRHGGDEMALLLLNYSAEEAVVLAEKIRKEIELLTFNLGKTNATVSIGIGIFPDHASDSASLFKCADEAMYLAKNRGGNLVRVSGEPDSSENAPRIIPRRQPTSANLSDDEVEGIRTTYFAGRQPQCPKDGCPLRISETHRVGFKTPHLLVRCPLCGLQERIPGIPATGP